MKKIIYIILVLTTINSCKSVKKNSEEKQREDLAYWEYLKIKINKDIPFEKIHDREYWDYYGNFIDDWTGRKLYSVKNLNVNGVYIENRNNLYIRFFIFSDNGKMYFNYLELGGEFLEFPDALGIIKIKKDIYIDEKEGIEVDNQILKINKYIGRGAYPKADLFIILGAKPTYGYLKSKNYIEEAIVKKDTISFTRSYKLNEKGKKKFFSKETILNINLIYMPNINVIKTKNDTYYIPRGEFKLP
ncbi:hypothetical protein QIU18_03610 [Capnocytophaga canimorsus]|nr:hypothetical protein [Capnocytophaga canimorsus]WGU71074.1 hypothetical protein QIU18_03610 [Capnocytophaga canimorsus]